ncbi:unnamed protein product [Owenia fusiformis]|nr:unnamed protein product [Owenia fusiformis]
MIQERSDIERDYSERLREWGTKWKKDAYKYKRNPIAPAVAEMAKASERVADIHKTMADEMTTRPDSVGQDMKRFTMSTYHRGHTTGKCQVSKDIEVEFENAQREYAIQLHTMLSAKKHYYKANKAHQKATDKYHDASSNGRERMSRESDENFKMRILQTEVNLENTLREYLRSIESLNNGPKQIYIEKMTKAFERCQDIEYNRLQTTTRILLDFIRALDQPCMCSDTYENVVAIAENISIEDCLAIWSREHGVECRHQWPRFQEYDDFLKTEPKRRKSWALRQGRSLTDTIQRSVLSLLGVQRDDSTKPNVAANRKGNEGYYAELEPVGAVSPLHVDKYQADPNEDFWTDSDEDQWDSIYEELKPKLANIEGTENEEAPAINVNVRALQDHVTSEPSYLEFRKDDVIYQMSVEENGLCFGSHENAEGYYPSSIVTVIRYY